MGFKKRLFEKIRNSRKSKPHLVFHSPQPRTGEKPLAKEQSAHHNPNKARVLKKVFKVDHDFPPGIRMLLVFSIIMGVLYIILASLFSFTMAFGVVIQGAASRFLNIIMILVIAFMTSGIAKKKIWGYYLSLCVFSFIILNSLISMFFIKKSVSGLLTLFVILSFFFMLLMNSITLWYVKSKKEYFIHYYHPSHMSKEDKAFVYGLTMLWLAFIFTAGILGNAYYNETVQKADDMISELSGVYPYKVEDFCQQKSEDRDLCLLTGAVMYEDEANPNRLCQKITSQFYRYTCFKAIQGDVA